MRASAVDELRVEPRLLLDPVDDNVESVLRIELDSKSYLWEVDPAAPAPLQERANATINFFNLNKDPELKTDRLNAIQHFLQDITSIDARVRERARLSASRYVQHGAALRSILAQTQSALLPTVEEELRGHVVECVQILRAVTPGSDPDTEELARYALAAIWCTPPTGVTRKLVAAWYRDAEVADAVRPLLKQLA